ncbi:MAG: integrase arm-type DNA-binding domain-containing protein [Pseudomonadota bacterium]
MARTFNKLSVLKVNNLSKPGLYCDGGGLWLQVSSTGSKSWVFRFTIGGRRFHMGLGSLRDVSLAIARELAHDCGRRVRAGGNPLIERHEAAETQRRVQAKQVTFDACASAFIAAHRSTWRNPKHVQQWENTLATYVGPVFGTLPVDQVDTALVVKALAPIWITTTETATRLRGRIEAILDWATVSKFRSGENPARWRGNLEFLLANPNKVAPVINRPALAWTEAPAFMTQLRARDGVSARALEFLIYTAGRSVEVRGATWEEIDFKESLWTVPAERMKAGREHRVPLAGVAKKLLQKMDGAKPAADCSKTLIFPGRRAVMLSDMSLTAVLRRMERPDITVHGFRSTFRDWCAEYASNTFSREVCEHALAHKLPDKVEAAYRRGDLLDKRRKLMDAWAFYLEGA